MNRREWKEIHGMKMGMCSIVKKRPSRKSNRRRNKLRHTAESTLIGYIRVVDGPWSFDALGCSGEALWACETFRQAKNRLLGQKFAGYVPLSKPGYGRTRSVRHFPKKTIVLSMPTFDQVMYPGRPVIVSGITS